MFGIDGKKASGKKCAAIEGLEEGEEIMKEAKDDTVRDAAMLAAAQAVEHYEISRYGTLVAWAGKMEMSDAAELLQATLDEEKLTDEKPTDLAETRPKPHPLAPASRALADLQRTQQATSKSSVGVTRPA